MQNTASRRPLILAIILHAILFLALFLHFSLSHNTPSLQLQPDVDIIKAVAVNPTDLQRATAAKAEQQKQQAAAEAAKQAEALQQQQAEAAAKKAAELAAQQAAEQARQAQQQAEQKTKQEVEIADQQAEKAAATIAQEEKAKQAQQAEKAAAEKAQQAKAAEETAKQDQLKKQQQAKKDAEKKQQQKAAQDLKLAQQKEMQNQIKAEQKQLEAARTDQQQSEIEKYLARIQETLRPNWNVPEGVNPDMSCQLAIRLGVDGTVLSVTITKSSGNVALDNSARTAVFKSSPLPVPDDPALAKQFRELNLTVSPKDMQ